MRLLSEVCRIPLELFECDKLYVAEFASDDLFKYLQTDAPNSAPPGAPINKGGSKSS